MENWVFLGTMRTHWRTENFYQINWWQHQRLFISFFSHHPKHWPHLHFLEHGGCGPHNTKSLGSPSSTPFSSKTGEMSSLPLCVGLGCKSRCPVTASWGGVQVQGLKFKLGQSQSVLPSFLSLHLWLITRRTQDGQESAWFAAGVLSWGPALVK